MTDDTPKNARDMTAEEYAAARAELLRETRKAEADADKARILREVEAKYKPKDSQQ